MELCQQVAVSTACCQMLYSYFLWEVLWISLLCRLLRAEKEYAMRNTMSARHLYDSAISSAHDHRFYHEEALSCELACIFYRETSKDDSEKRFNDLMKRASDRYEQWGATVKAKAIRSSLP